MSTGARPTTANVAMTSANTEYSYTFPVGTIKAILKIRAVNASAKFSFVSGASGTTYVTVPTGGSYTLENMKLSGVTIYFQSPSATQVMEIVSWKK